MMPVFRGGRNGHLVLSLTSPTRRLETWTLDAIHPIVTSLLFHDIQARFHG